jgi:hypothetical protein
VRLVETDAGFEDSIEVWGPPDAVTTAAAQGPEVGA